MTWSPGDLALCVVERHSPSEPCDPKRGSINTVASARSGWHVDTGELGFGLTFVGINPPSGYGYNAKNFRKINPLTDDERRQALRELDDVRPEVVA